jgi:hypothetical protein
VDLVAEGVAGLGGGSAVVAPAVGLDDEAEAGPVEVDLEAIDDLFGERGWETGGRGKRPEEDFEFVVGETEGMAVEERAQRPNARLARVAVEGGAQRIRIDSVALVGLVDGPLQTLRRKFGRKIDEGPNWLSKRNIEKRSHVIGWERRAASSPDP